MGLQSGVIYEWRFKGEKCEKSETWNIPPLVFSELHTHHEILHMVSLGF